MIRFSRSFRNRASLVSFVTAASLATLISRAQAQTVQTIYSDVATLQSAYTQAGATAASPTTLTVADDITLAPGATGAITSFSFSVANFNQVAVTARPIISFYANDGSGGGPGTLITDFLFTPITFTAGTGGNGSVAVYTINSSGATLFNVNPSAARFFVGETFDNGGTGSTATVAQLNLLGEGIYNPPSPGKSLDLFFQSTSMGSSVYGGSNPAGSFLYFGGSPAANFGFAFSGLSTAPEPSAVALTLSGSLLGLGQIVRRQRKRG